MRRFDAQKRNKFNKNINMSKFLHYLMLCLAVLAMPLAVQADDAEYQLPDPHFEDWSGTAFDGNAQPKY